MMVSQTDEIHLTLSRKNQFDDFLTCVFQDAVPFMDTRAWRANRMELASNMVDVKEQEKRDLAKKRSPANDFQRQIKFDPKQHPILRKESEFPKWKRVFNAAADAQGSAGALDASRTRLTMTPEDQDLDDVQNKAMCTVFQTTC